MRSSSRGRSVDDNSLYTVPFPESDAELLVFSGLSWLRMWLKGVVTGNTPVCPARCGRVWSREQFGAVLPPLLAVPSKVQVAHDGRVQHAARVADNETITSAEKAEMRTPTSSERARDKWGLSGTRYLAAGGAGLDGDVLDDGDGDRGQHVEQERALEISLRIPATLSYCTIITGPHTRHPLISPSFFSPEASFSARARPSPLPEPDLLSHSHQVFKRRTVIAS
eukprot:1754750-Rhodomonas_salina.3